jgi:putative DNA primase/helicase
MQNDGKSPLESTTEHPADVQQARLAAGAACHAAALRLHGLGLSPLRLCDPQHIGVDKMVKTHGSRCTHPGKGPLLVEWKPFQQRQPAPAEIDGWWKAYPIGNVGLVLGTQIVRIDVDSGEAHTLLLEWSADDLPETWEFLSPSTDYHQRLYAWPEGAPPAKICVEKLDGEHNELRLMGLGAQTAMPPSRHKNGGVYRWVDGKSPDDIPLAPAPAWLIDRMTETKPQAERAPRKSHPESSDGTQDALRIKHKMLQQVRDAQMGTRRATRLRVGKTIGGLVASGELPASAEDELIDVAREHSQHPDNAEKDVSDAMHHGEQLPFVPFAPRTPDIPLSDTYNAARLVQQHGGLIRYCGEWDKVLVYSGGVWETDHGRKVIEYAKATAAAMHKEACKQKSDVELESASIDLLSAPKETVQAFADRRDAAEVYLKHAIKAHSANALRNMVDLAKSVPPVPISHEVLDTHDYLLPVENGVVDLKTGALLPHDPSYLFTRRMPVVFDPKATCPNWERALLTMMGGSLTPDSPDDSAATLAAREKQDAGPKRLVRFLQQTIGMSLTGDVREHMLVIFWGSGRNGKGVISEVLLSMFKSFGTKATQELLMQNRFDAHPTEKTDLFGRRLVITSETDQNRRLNLGFVKEATGGDTMKARRMREDFWEFYPTHHIFLSTNHKPIIEEDDAIWERIYLVPFERKFENPSRLTEEQRRDPNTPIRDTQLKEKLLSELPGILNWALSGCLAWQRDGLYVPDEVLSATAEYRRDEDVIARFIEEECHVIASDSVKVTPMDLFEAYKRWGARTNEDRQPLTQRKFGEAMTKRGYTQDRTKAKRYWKGIGLSAANLDDNEGEGDKTLEK